MNTSLLRISRVHPLAFYALLLGVGFALALAGPIFWIDWTDPGPWLRPDGSERPMSEVYSMALEMALVPLIPGLLVWSWAVSGWRFVLRDCTEREGVVEAVGRGRDCWTVRFTYPDDPVESVVSLAVMPVASIRRLEPGQTVGVLVSTRDPRRALLRACFA